MSEIWKRKYEWRVTWPGENLKDWVATHDRLIIGRVRLDTTSLHAGKYSWSGNCSSWWGFEGPMPHSGWELEAWQAAKRVEGWYDEGCAATGPRPAIVDAIITSLEERMANWPPKPKGGY